MNLNLGLTFLGLILVTIGVIMVYDARILTKKLFGFGDQNEAVCGFKILGFIISIIGGLIIYFYMKWSI